MLDSLTVWAIAALFGLLQSLALLILAWMRGDLKALNETAAAIGERISGHETRLQLIERDCVRNHTRRSTDPAEYDGKMARANGGERGG